MLMITFIKPKKIISEELKEFLFVKGFHNIYEDLENSDNGKNYFAFSVSDKSKISYLSGDRIPKDDSLLFDGEYRKSKAYHTRIAKLLSDNISQQDKQKISALLFDRGFTEQRGLFLTNKIKKYYLEDNYNKDSFGGSLHNSCMRYSSLQDAIGLYENMGSNIVELLVLTDKKGYLLARALLWKNVIKNDKKIEYLDRVYAVNDNFEYKLYDYAKENKILSYRDKTFGLKIKIDIDENVPIPYFDTFQSYGCGILFSEHGGEYLLDNVDGVTLEGLDDNRHSCGSCEDEFDPEETGGYSDCQDEYLCDDCGVYCDDDFRLRDDCILIDCEYYAKDSEVICYSDYDEEYYLIEDCFFSEYHNSFFNQNNADIVFVESEDDYYLSGDDCIYFDEDEQEYKLKTEDEENEEIENITIEILKNNEIQKIKGFCHIYTKDTLKIELVIHRCINDDKLWVVSELKSGLLVSRTGSTKKENALKDTINRLNSKSLVDIKNAIQQGIDKKQELLNNV